MPREADGSERDSFSRTNFMDVLGSGHRREDQTALSSQQGRKERKRETGEVENVFSLSVVTSVKTSCPRSFPAAPLPRI